MIQEAVRTHRILADGAVGFAERAAEHFSAFHPQPYEAAPRDIPLDTLLTCEFSPLRIFPIAKFFRDLER